MSSPPARLLVVTITPSGGGAEQVASAWVRGLEALGHTVSVVLCGRGTTAAVTELPVILARGRAHPLVFALYLAVCIRRQRPDAVISVLTFSNLLALAAARLVAPDVPVIISEHNVPDLLTRQEGRSERLQRLVARAVYRRATAVIAVSHAVATNLLASYSVDPDRCWVIPNAVLQGDPGTPDQPPQCAAVDLLSPGRLVPQKQPMVALDVVETLSKRGVSATLTFIGDGPLRCAVEAEAGRRSLPVRFRDWDPDWAAGAAAGTVALLTSRVEGLANVLITAAAEGLPVVAPSAALGVADAVIPGVTGILYNTYHPELIADAVLEATQLDRPFGVEGWLRQYSTSHAVGQLNRLVDHCLVTGGTGSTTRARKSRAGAEGTSTAR
jgi:glycosyltransferase involved in cell wall biosynthesis